jgi:ribosomal protein S18 acetylase RimI-like enzyme
MEFNSNKIEDLNHAICSKTEQIITDKKKKRKIFSDAFPPNKLGEKPKTSAISEIHKKIGNIKIDENNIYFKEFTKEHMNEIKILHKEWFPIDYDDSFYEKMFAESNPKERNPFYNYGAFYKADGQEYILGGIFCEMKEESHLKRYIQPEVMKNYQISFYEDILNFTPQYKYLYIMTIGVIDECRRLKLGTKLLNLVTDHFMNTYNCLGIYLHVVEYNNTAIKFYMKNEFLDLALVKNYYCIGDNYYSSKVFVKFFSSLRKSRRKSHIHELSEVFLINPLKLLVFLITFFMFFRCLRRKHKIL